MALSKEVLERLIARSTDIVVATDRDGNVSYYNDGASRILGYSGEEILGAYVARVYLDLDEAKRVMLAMREEGHGGKGIVPKERGKGQTYRVRAFDHLIDGVKSYARNLNTHAAYKKFRAMRSEFRQKGKALNGYQLAEALTAYSERGRAYVETIRSIIRVNGLDQFDKVRLGDQVSIRSNGPGA